MVPANNALAVVSLSRDPFADVGRTVSEFDAVRFVDRQEFHTVTVDQLEFGKFDGDDTAVVERGAKHIKVIPCNPPTDVQHQTSVSRNSVDSPRHVSLARPVVR
jgi:hypothetical protein